MTHPALLNDYQSMQPSPPTDLCIEGITFDSALLGFTQPTGPQIFNYNIRVSGPLGRIGDPIWVNTCGAELKGLRPATTYTVTVCSIVGGTTSTASEECTFRTLGDSGAMIGDSRRNKQLEDQVVELRDQVQRLQAENHRWRTAFQKLLDESP